MLDARSFFSFCFPLVLTWRWGIGLGAMAQETDAVCMEQLGWMRNSLGQSPCLVDASVEGACHSDGGTLLFTTSSYSAIDAHEDWSIPASQGPSSFYAGPSVRSANKCSCSSVAFSLSSACAFCQGASLNSWSNFILNCSADEVTNPGYPHNIPEGTTVPSWAFAAVDTDVDKWDFENAKNLAFTGAPDFSLSNPPPDSGDSQSSDINSPTSVSSRSSTREPSSVTSPPSRPTPTTNHLFGSVEPSTPSSSSISLTVSTTTLAPDSTDVSNTSNGAAGEKRKTPVGVIVGGVIGGSVGLLLLCAAVVGYRYVQTPRALHSRKGSVSTNGSDNSQSSYSHVDEKYPEPPNSAGLPVSPFSIYDPFRSTSVTSLPHVVQQDEEADLDNRFFNVPPHHAVPENFEFVHAV